jgi:hypothetical protein
MAGLFPDVFALLEGEFGTVKEADEVKKNQKVRMHGRLGHVILFLCAYLIWIRSGGVGIVPGAALAFVGDHLGAFRFDSPLAFPRVLSPQTQAEIDQFTLSESLDDVHRVVHLLTKGTLAQQTSAIHVYRLLVVNTKAGADSAMFKDPLECIMVMCHG